MYEIRSRCVKYGHSKQCHRHGQHCLHRGQTGILRILHIECPALALWVHHTHPGGAMVQQLDSAGWHLGDGERVGIVVSASRSSSMVGVEKRAPHLGHALPALYTSGSQCQGGTSLHHMDNPIRARSSGKHRGPCCSHRGPHRPHVLQHHQQPYCPLAGGQGIQDRSVGDIH